MGRGISNSKTYSGTYSGAACGRTEVSSLTPGSGVSIGGIGGLKFFSIKRGLNGHCIMPRLILKKDVQVLGENV
jgi:hypothetical protein